MRTKTKKVSLLQLINHTNIESVKLPNTKAEDDQEVLQKQENELLLLSALSSLKSKSCDLSSNKPMNPLHTYFI